MSWVSITEEQRRFEPIKSQLGIPDHTTYAGPRPTYTNLEYSTPPVQPIATWVHAIPAISPLPVRK